MKTVKFKNSWKEVGYGANGTVYKTSSNRCLKIMDGGDFGSDDGFEKKVELLDSGYLDDAKSEFASLRAAHKKKKGICPKPYGLKVILKQKLYYIAIEMEYLSGYEKLEDFDIYHMVYAALKKAKIQHHDLHEGNIMVRATKDGLTFKVVDFG